MVTGNRNDGNRYNGNEKWEQELGQERGMENGERGTGKPGTENGERGTRNGEKGMGNEERGTLKTCTSC